MTVIFEHGDEFWIEYLRIGGTALPNAAGRTTTASVLLERSGHYVGGYVNKTFIENNSNAQGYGTEHIRNNLGGTIAQGDLINGIQIRFDKIIGTGTGTITFEIIVFLKKGR